MPSDPIMSSVGDQPLHLMIEALGLEIQAIKKVGGSTTIELFDGLFVAESGGNFIYRFPFHEDIQLRDDTPIRIQFEQREVNGSIASVGQGAIVLALEENLGPRVSHVKLVADDSFLVERLRDRLQQVQSGEARFNMAAANRAIGKCSINSGKGQVASRILEELNEEQSEAVILSVASDMTFVWGPPGTGKTTALARIVEAHYFAGRSVLLVSNTNIAVDTALEKIAQRLQTEPGFHEGAVLRFGPVVKDELLRDFGDQVILENVVARLSESLEQELSAARAEAARVSQEIQRLRSILKQHEEIASVAAELGRQRESQKSLAAKIQELTSQLEMCASELNSLRQDLERARTMGAVRRFFAGLNLENLGQQILRAEMQHRATSEALREAERQYHLAESNVQQLEAHVRELQRLAVRLPPKAECESQLLPCQRRLKELQGRIAELQRQIEQVRQEVLKRCRIMATTVYRTYLKGQVEKQFDVVVIDEASMLMLPMSFYAAGIAAKSVVVGGDFRQLPPIVLSDGPLAAEWLNTDIFCKAGIPQVATRGAVPHLAALRVQYRMRDPICNVTNELFYNDHRLLTYQGVQERTIRPMPLGQKEYHQALLYINTSPLGPWAAMKLGKYTRYNLLHALLIKKMVVHLSHSGYLKVENAIGAIAPYSAQVKLIQALLEDEMGADARHFAATVHRFQGNEKEAILLDLTDSVGCRLGKFMKGVSYEDDGWRLLNVAVSRARDHIVLVANFDYLRVHAPKDGIVIRLLEEFEENGTALNLGAILPLGDDDWMDGLHKIVTPNIELRDDQWGLFSASSFYPAFARDMENARDTCIILSPFLTGHGAGRWANHFHAALQRGVGVRIVTRPPGEFGGASEEEVWEMVVKLRELGVVVDLRERMHEKVAIIDQQIAWHGSLNILSHRDTSECMLRLTGQNACRHLVEMISLRLRRREEAWKPSDSENPLCEECGTPTIMCNGRYGIYFRCPRCRKRMDPRRRSSSQRTRRSSSTHGRRTNQPAANGHIPCSRAGCGGVMVPRNGPHGPFLGCTNFPGCRETKKL